MTTIYRGITHTEEIEVLRADGTADDLTGHVLRAEIRSPEGGLIADISEAFGLKAGTENVIEFKLTDEITWALPDGKFIWDLVSESGGDTFFIVPTEALVVTTPATRPE